MIAPSPQPLLESAGLCPHQGRHGSYGRARELGAFIETPRPSAQHGHRNPSSAGGLRIAVKDNIDVRGWPTRAGSEATSASPLRRDAHVVAQLKAAGGVVAAKTRLDEFALTTAGPGMRNPFDERRSVGGSSGGSALAVAAGGFCLALGTDTGGSVRIPASYCGVVGFKPSFGVVALDGVVPVSVSLDCVGVLSCSVAMACCAFRVLAQNAHPSNLLLSVVSKELQTRKNGLDGLRVGIPTRGFLADANTAVREAFAGHCKVLRNSGATVTEIKVPTFESLGDIHYAIAAAEAWEYHQRHFSDLRSHGPVAREVILRGRSIGLADYEAAQSRRLQLTSRVDDALASVDVFALPTSPTTAPDREATAIRLGTGKVVDPTSAAIWFTALFNDTGMPAVTVPILQVSGTPVGLQLVNSRGQDFRLLQIAEEFERAFALTFATKTTDI